MKDSSVVMEDRLVYRNDQQNDYSKRYYQRNKKNILLKKKKDKLAKQEGQL